jgi:hypothetical protein
MTEYVVSYDLKETAPKPHKEFILAAEKEGLLYVFQVTDLYRLPNTTIWGNFDSAEAVKAAFERAQTAAEKKLGIKIVLEKRLISELDDWLIRSNEKKAAEKKWTGSTKFETCRKHQLNDPFFVY